MDGRLGGGRGSPVVAVRRTTHVRRGALLIELAITLPLILLLIMGLMEYSWLFLKTQQITNAAHLGARTGARADAGLAEVNAAVDFAMSAAGMSGVWGFTVIPDPAVLGVGEMVTVTVSVAYADIGFGFPLVPTPATLEAAVTMAREGPP